MKHFRRVLTSVGCTLVMGAVFSSFVSAASVGTVTASGTLNVRSTPSTSAAIVDRLPSGTQVNVLNSSGNWYEIEKNGVAGYVSAEYLSVAQTQTAVVSASGGLNLREAPDGAKLLTLPDGASVEVLETSGDWTKVSYGGQTGYVASSYLTSTSGLPTLYIAASGGLNLRSEASANGAVLATIPYGTSILPIGEVWGWYQVQYAGQTGWVSAEYVTSENLANRSAGGRDMNAAAVAADLLAYAKSYLGTPYVYGGSSPKGFDCSGYVQYVYKHFGYSLNRTATQQSKQGVAVSKSELQPGDLVFFSQGSKRIGHVGIYVGDGKFIHSSSPGDVVKYDKLSSSYYAKRYVCATRII